MNLESSLDQVRGVGAKTWEKLESANLRTVGDILNFFPRKYEDFTSLTTLAEIKPGKVLFRARAEKVSLRRVRRGMTVVEATLTDGNEKIKAVWFNQAYRVAQLKTDDELFFSGKFEFSYNRYQLTNPSVLRREELPNRQNFAGESGEILPIYKQVKGLKTQVLRKILTELKPMMKILPETLPQSVILSENLAERSWAIENIHFPQSPDSFNRAWARLAFEEIFSLILAAKINRLTNEKIPGYQIDFALNEIKQSIRDLPFELTDSQRLAAWEIIQDMKRPQPMNRLLQGDVGSGKTVVAALTSLNAAQAGFQVAVIAPTEILASQLAENFSKILAKTNLNIAFLAGSVKGSARKHIYERLASGEIDIIVGTHAIIQDKVKFSQLGLVIIDEQHRFGVEQRQKILQKSNQKMPHLLAMTATPIPRSLQLTLFGDLSVSVLKDKPKNRQPIKTELISPNSRQKMNQLVQSEIAVGRQVFVVVPAISAGKNDQIPSVETEYKRLKSAFKNAKIAQLHGGLPAETKDQVMRDFLEKKFDILLSTTVIEVGIDVPNASVMIIEDADRFGLSQLHQLRGRVGRGQAQSYAFLVMSSSAKPPARLLEIEKSDDGFYLAEKDLQLRGPGEIYGRAQSGELRLDFASYGDLKLIARAQKAVDKFAESQDFTDFINQNKNLEKYRRLTLLN